MKSGTALMKSLTWFTSGGTTSTPMSVRTSSAADEDDARGGQTTHSAALQHLHRGVQRRRQQDRDQDPREHLPGEVAEEQHHDDERRDSENREDGSRVHVNNTSLRSHHAGEFVVLCHVPGLTLSSELTAAEAG